VLYICIPTYNEAPTVGVLLWRIRAIFQEYSREYEIVAYDDASTDSTADTLEPYKEVLPLSVLRGKIRAGYPAAVEACFREVVRRTRYPRRDAIIVMQADFTDAPEQLPELVRRFEGGADVVVADRTGSAELPKPVRRLKLLSSLLVKRFTGLTGVGDPFSGFRLYRVSVIKDLLAARGNAGLVSAPGLAANLQLLLAASRVARRVESVPLLASYDVRLRESRVRPVSDAVELYRFALGSWKAPVAPPAPAAPARGGR
jgi:glycosyltransferase involved in cell wall biosynthesis